MPNLTNQNRPWTISSLRMHFARIESDNELINFIRNNRDILNLTDEDEEDGESSLLHSVFTIHNGLNIVRHLIAHGADVNAQDINGDTPLHYYPNNTRACRLLIESGADIDIQNNNERTPLHRAVEMRSIDTIRLLIEHGADVHAQDINGDTPLHNPMSLAACQLLIAYGADVNAENNNERTPLHIAVEMESIDTIRLLIAHGANVHAQDINGDTPSSLAYNTELYSLFPGQENLEILGDSASDTSE